MRAYLDDFLKENGMGEKFHYNVEVNDSTFVGDGYITKTSNGVYKSKFLLLAVGINAKAGDGSQYIPKF